MAIAICRGCGKAAHPALLFDGFCDSCRKSFADELLSLYDWMNARTAEVFKRHSIDYATLVLPTYRHAFEKSEFLRCRMAFPEGLSDRADHAREALGTLERLCTRAMLEKQLKNGSFDAFDEMSPLPNLPKMKNDETSS